MWASAEWKYCATECVKLEERKCNMAERRNSVVCTFDPITPKITTYDVHELMHDILRIRVNAVNMMHIDDMKRQVYIKLAETQCVQTVLRDTCGQKEHRHNNGEISTVGIAIAGKDRKKLRNAKLP